MIAEMSGNLPRSDVVFDASTAAEFMELAKASNNCGLQLRSLKDMVSLLLDDDWTKPEAVDLSHIGLEHLSTVMFGQLSSWNSVPMEG